MVWKRMGYIGILGLSNPYYIPPPSPGNHTPPSSNVHYIVVQSLRFQFLITNILRPKSIAFTKVFYKKRGKGMDNFKHIGFVKGGKPLTKPILLRHHGETNRSSRKSQNKPYKPMPRAKQTALPRRPRRLHHWIASQNRQQPSRFPRH